MVSLTVFGGWLFFYSGPIKNITFKIESIDEIEVKVVKPGDDIKMSFNSGSHSFDFSNPHEDQSWEISVFVKKLNENKNPVNVIIKDSKGAILYNKAFNKAEFVVDFDSVL
jgi:hypothetical protein